MTGKLKIKGDMGKAMKLEKLMGAMQSKLWKAYVCSWLNFDQCKIF